MRSPVVRLGDLPPGRFLVPILADHFLIGWQRRLVLDLLCHYIEEDAGEVVPLTASGRGRLFAALARLECHRPGCQMSAIARVAIQRAVDAATV